MGWREAFSSESLIPPSNLQKFATRVRKLKEETKQRQNHAGPAFMRALGLPADEDNHPQSKWTDKIACARGEYKAKHLNPIFFGLTSQSAQSTIPPRSLRRPVLDGVGHGRKLRFGRAVCAKTQKFRSSRRIL